MIKGNYGIYISGPIAGWVDVASFPVYYTGLGPWHNSARLQGPM